MKVRHSDPLVWSGRAGLECPPGVWGGEGGEGARLGWERRWERGNMSGGCTAVRDVKKGKGRARWRARGWREGCSMAPPTSL